MRRGLLAACALCVGATAAGAQYLPFGAQRLGYPVPSDRPSVRLQGMADLGLVIADENRELNLSDFGGNLAGMANDRDGWTFEAWGSSGSNVEDYAGLFRGSPVRHRNRFDQEIAAAEAVYRKTGKRAVGVVGVWNGWRSETRYGDNRRTRGPDVTAFYNEVFGDLSAAIGVGIHSDNEDVVSTDVFAIRHFSDARSLTFAAAYGALGLKWAGQIDLESITINGRSRDPAGFHQDDFEWLRPTRRYRLSVLGPERSRLGFGVNLERVTIDGTEEGRFSWSNRFPENPSNVNFLVEAPTFEEEERVSRLEGRMSYDLRSTVRLGASAAWETRDSQVVSDPGSNFIGSRSAEDGEETFLRVGGGIGTEWLARRLRIGVEGFVVSRSSDFVYPRSSVSSDSRRFEARLGGEYILPSSLVFRAGYVRGGYDEDVDRPQSLYVTNGVTVGLGYVPRGGMVQVDAAYRYRIQEADYDGGADRETEQDDLSVAVRFLL